MLLLIRRRDWPHFNEMSIGTGFGFKAMSGRPLKIPNNMRVGGNYASSSELYRDMCYVVDLRHPLQAPCGEAALVDGLGSGFGGLKTWESSSKPWECGNHVGISKGCGKGGRPVARLSRFSTDRHFHGSHFIVRRYRRPEFHEPAAFAQEFAKSLSGAATNVV
jgi:hypothetical protein